MNEWMISEYPQNDDETLVAKEDLRPIHFVSRIVAVIAIGLLTYAGSFGGKFVFDDHSHIEKVSSGFDWHDFERARRPLLMASLAYNYEVGGTNPWGYHLLNVSIHLCTAVLLFLVAYRTLTFSDDLTSLSQSTLLNLAWVASLIWVVHPLNTQAVTYIVQRGEAMSAMFAFLAIFALFQASTRRWTVAWLVLMIVSCWAGFASKQVAAAIPFILIVYDWCFCSKNFKELVLRRGWCYLILLLSLVWFSSDLFPGNIPDESANPKVVKTVSAGFSYKGATVLQYAATQPGVVLYYLRLAVWPDPLCLDYRWPLETNTFRIVWTSALVLLSIGVIAWGLLRKRWWSFWFTALLLWLAPTSSFLPIADPMVEHRMYLPLACLSVVLTVLTWQAWTLFSFRLSSTLQGGLSVVVVLGLIIVLMGLTHLRNLEYRNPIRIWLGVVQVNSNNARAQIEVADYFLRARDYERALTHFTKARKSCGQRGEECLNAEFGLGMCNLLLGSFDAAEKRFLNSIKLSKLLEIDASRPVKLWEFTKRLKSVNPQERDEVIQEFFRPKQPDQETNDSEFPIRRI